MDKEQRLLVLQDAWRNCQGCMLHQERKNTVLGQGNPDAQLMIIGEAPGATEDSYGIPFVGASGNLLEYFLSWVSADTNQVDLLNNWNDGDNSFDVSRGHFSLPNIFFTNIVACRPPENRNPASKEIASCKPRLLDQIYTVDPTLIITIGGLATEAVIGKKVAITAKRGQLFDSVVPGKIVDVTYPVFAVLHMSYLLRMNDFNNPEGMADKTYHDFVTAMHILDSFNFYHRGVGRPSGRPPLKETH